MRVSAEQGPTDLILSTCHSTVWEKIEVDSGLSCYPIAANSSDGGMIAVHMQSLTPAKNTP